MKSIITLLIVAFGLGVAAQSNRPSASEAFCTRLRLRVPAIKDKWAQCLVAADNCAKDNNGNTTHKCFYNEMRNLDRQAPPVKSHPSPEEFCAKRTAPESKDEWEKCLAAAHECAKENNGEMTQGCYNDKKRRLNRPASVESPESPQEFCNKHHQRGPESSFWPTCLNAADECARSNNGQIEMDCYHKKYRSVDQDTPLQRPREMFEKWVNDKCLAQANDDEQVLQRCKEATELCSKTTSEPWASNPEWNRDETCYNDKFTKSERRTEQEARADLLEYKNQRQCKMRWLTTSGEFDNCKRAFKHCTHQPYCDGRYFFKTECVLDCMNKTCPPRKDFVTCDKDELPLEDGQS